MMRGLAAMVIGMVLASSAAAETLRVEGIFPAQAREASFLPTIAVGTFSGRTARNSPMRSNGRLAKLGADGLPHVRLIPPSLRLDGMLTGRTDVSVVDSDHYSETRERCVEEEGRQMRPQEVPQWC